MKLKFDSTTFLQRSQRAILDIDHRVQIISGTARKYYSAMELSPFLDNLEQHTQDTKRLMNDLSMSLKCDPIFRYEVRDKEVNLGLLMTYVMLSDRTIRH